MKIKDQYRKAYQQPAHDSEKEAIIKQQAQEQSDGVNRGLFSSAFSYNGDFPPMCDGYKALNERMRTAPKTSTRSTDLTIIDASPLPPMQQQPTLH